MNGRRSLRVMLVCCLLVLAAAPAAHATVTREIERPDGKPTGHISLSPGRLEQDDLQPGVPLVAEYSVHNDRDAPVDVSLVPGDFGPSSDPGGIGAQIEHGEFGAGSWITPEISSFRLGAFETITFNVTIVPPANAPVGTNLGSLSVRTAPADGAVGADDQRSGSVAFELIGQLFLTVAGQVRHDLSVPRIRTRDAYVTGSTRFVVWDVDLHNAGTVNEHVTGSLVAKSLFGNQAFEARIKDIVVLRGDTRTVRVVWHGPPWVGAFTPHVKLMGDDRKVHTADGDRVVVLPWWLPVLLVLVVLLPILVLWVRRRNNWQAYMDEGEGGDEPAFDDPSRFDGH